MRASILALIAALACSSSAAGAENLSSEVLLPGHEATDAFKPAMAFGGDVYLLAWQAGRNEKADIVGMRLDKTGKPLDEKPFVISAARDCQERPRLAFGGGVFMVVWHDLRNGKDFDVCAARVTPAGKVSDPAGIVVAQGERNQCEPGVCWDGKNFQVLWRGFQGEKEDAGGVNRLPAAGYHVYGGRVSAEGKPLDGEGIFMAKPVREYLTPKSMGMAAGVALPNGKVLATARSGGALCLWRVADGKPAGEPALIPKGRGFDDSAFATDGKTILLVWTTFRDGGGRSSGVDKSGMALLGADGEVGSAAPKSLSSLEREPRVRHPAPVWDGKRYVVVWDVPRKGKEFNYEALFLRCFAPDGAPLGNDEPVVNDPDSPAYWPAAASDGAGTTIIAYERHPRTADVPVRIAVRVIK